MRVALPFVVLLLQQVPSQAQLQVFTLEHNTTSSIYTNLDSAIANSVNGDMITLPGGLITFSGTIRKGVTLIGAGFFPDSTVATSQTIITNAVNIKGGASNASLNGIHFQSAVNIDSCTNVLISRCRMAYSLSLSISITNSQGIVINGCVMNAFATNTATSGIVAQNNLIYGLITCLSGSTSFLNNIFFAPSYNNSGLFYNGGAYVTNCIFTNNIIYSSGVLTASSSNNYYNNIFTSSVNNQQTAIFQNNKFNYSLGSLLANVASLATYSNTDNFHLAPGSMAIGAGLGGTDCGIYGGSTPWKEGALPYNPHIHSATVPGVTDQNGNLNVIFKVSAQDN